MEDTMIHGMEGRMRGGGVKRGVEGDDDKEEE